MTLIWWNSRLKELSNRSAGRKTYRIRFGLISAPGLPSRVGKESDRNRWNEYWLFVVSNTHTCECFHPSVPNEIPPNTLHRWSKVIKVRNLWPHWLVWTPLLRSIIVSEANLEGYSIGRSRHATHVPYQQIEWHQPTRECVYILVVFFLDQTIMSVMLIMTFE